MLRVNALVFRESYILFAMARFMETAGDDMPTTVRGLRAIRIEAESIPLCELVDMAVDDKFIESRECVFIAQ